MTREQALIEFMREEVRKRRVAEESFVRNGYNGSAERCGLIAAELSTIIALAERGDHLIGRDGEWSTPKCQECGGDLGGTHLGRLEEHKSWCSRFPL